MKTTGLLAVMALSMFSVLLTGCQTQLVGGTPINPAVINGLVVGMPYSEVVGELGPPLILVDGERVIAYPWNTHRGYFDIYPSWDPSRELYTKEINPLYHALCLRFDAQKKLAAWTCIQAPTVPERDQQLRAFGSQHPPARSDR